MENLATIIYCSSNRESPDFEQRIRNNILKNCGDIPIVSVTQKPIDFGTNICVGEDIGVSGFNFFRQTQIACENTKTKWIICCEADCLYPPDYFQFIPEDENKCYRNSNLYVMAHKRTIFWKKEEGATHAQIISREFYLKTLNKLFEGCPQWNAEEKNFPKERLKKEDVFNKKDIEFYETINPVVQFKTSDSMRHYTNSDRQDRLEIPYWGLGSKLKPQFIIK